jgi:hypothetical protein
MFIKTGVNRPQTPLFQPKTTPGRAEFGRRYTSIYYALEV